jgi:two-component system, NtrC family, response regulator AtoC
VHDNPDAAPPASERRACQGIAGAGLEIVKKKTTTTPTPDAADLQGLRLLVVDDDEGARGWLAEILAHVGCQVKEASTGLGALDELAENGPFHLVVTDVYMPPPSGLQLVAMARTTGYDGPFLLVTAFPDQDMVDFASGSARTELLSKPFTADELLRRASALLR